MPCRLVFSIKNLMKRLIFNHFMWQGCVTILVEWVLGVLTALKKSNAHFERGVDKDEALFGHKINS